MGEVLWVWYSVRIKENWVFPDSQTVCLVFYTQHPFNLCRKPMGLTPLSMLHIRNWVTDWLSNLPRVTHQVSEGNLVSNPGSLSREQALSYKRPLDLETWQLLMALVRAVSVESRGQKLDWSMIKSGFGVRKWRHWIGSVPWRSLAMKGNRGSKHG